MLHRDTPFLRIVIPLCAGIISGLYVKISPDVVILILAFLLVAFFITLIFNRTQINILFGVVMNLTMVFMGYLLYSNEKKSISILKQEVTEIICTLSDFPEERENSYRVKADLNFKFVNDSLKPLRGSLLLYLKKDSSANTFRPGDALKIKCIPVEIKNRGNPYEFDYKFYMQNQGIRYLAFLSNSDITGRFVPEKRMIKHKALIIREKIIEMYKNRGITGRNLALVAAMTVGEKALLEPEQKENFVRAGVMHIMAVSGLHAVVLSLFVFNILFFLNGRLDILRILIALILLWAFAFVTGLTPSVMRATLMFTFIQTGNLLKRPANTMNSVLASAFVLIIFRPSVIFDAGFLLSYSAVIFIIAFYRDLYYKIHLKNWLTDKIWQSVAVTLVAQAGTLSLTIMLFNRFPVYFLITNIIIVPLSSLLIIAGCLLPMLYPFVFLSQILGIIISYISELTEFLTGLAASLPGSSLEGLGMTVTECIIVSAMLALMCTLFINNQKRHIGYLLGLVLIITIVSTVKIISVRRSDELIVYNVPGKTVVGIRTGCILNLYSTEDNVTNEVLRHSSTLGLKIKSFKYDQVPICLEAGNKRILITNSINKQILLMAKPDIVVLSGVNPSIKGFSGLEKYPEVVILSSESFSSFSTSEYFGSLPYKPVYNTRRSGAFKMSL